MKKDILLTVPSYFRDDMNVMGYRFGKGEKSCVVLGALRGDEIQQLYVCARLVAYLREVERDGGIMPGKSVMVVPTAIGFSMNTGDRLWAPESMDFNRRFPGDLQGQTSERITGALFERLKAYKYGVQLTSFYQPGSFIPHVRVMDTGLRSWAASSACPMSTCARRATQISLRSTTHGSLPAPAPTRSTPARPRRSTKTPPSRRFAPSSASSTDAASSAAT